MRLRVGLRVADERHGGLEGAGSADQRARADDRRDLGGRGGRRAAEQRARPARGDASARSGSGSGSRSRAGASSADSEDEPEMPERPDRNEGSDLAADAAELAAIGRALVALAHVTPGASAGPDAAIVCGGELEADLGAWSVAGGRRVEDAATGPQQEGLDTGDGDAEGAPELFVAQPLEFAHQQGRALLLGQ